MKLKELREARCATQLAIAKQLGIPYHSYNKYELGTIEPDIATLIKIANFYGITVDYLLGRKIENIIDKATLTEHQKKLLEFSMAYDDEMNEDFLNVLYGYVSRIEPKTQPIYKNKETI